MRRERYGGRVYFTKPKGYRGYWLAPNDPDDLAVFPPLQRAQIVQLACLEPIAKGLHITHWSSRDLAIQAVRDGIVSVISEQTVQRILRAVDWQPHRTRYWRTARLDTRFKQRTEQILWCYANAKYLAEKWFLVICVDEMPNCQVLERQPLRRAIPGFIEHQEFEYKRHGTVTILVFLVVHSGLMEAMILERKDAVHYVQALEKFRQRHGYLRDAFLIHDGDSSHTAKATQAYLTKYARWWRCRYTPAHASWLNQAEILIHAFRDRYLKRQSWKTRKRTLNMSWLRGLNTINVTLNRSNGAGPIIRCDDGSKSMPANFGRYLWPARLNSPTRSAVIAQIILKNNLCRSIGYVKDVLTVVLKDYFIINRL